MQNGDINGTIPYSFCYVLLLLHKMITLHEWLVYEKPLLHGYQRHLRTFDSHRQSKTFLLHVFRLLRIDVLYYRQSVLFFEPRRRFKKIRILNSCYVYLITELFRSADCVLLLIAEHIFVPFMLHPAYTHDIAYGHRFVG